MLLLIQCLLLFPLFLSVCPWSIFQLLSYCHKVDSFLYLVLMLSWVSFKCVIAAFTYHAYFLIKEIPFRPHLE